MSKNNTSYLQTFSKGLQVLEFLAEKKSTTVTTLSKQLGLQKSASYRFLNTLRLHGFLEQDNSNNYTLTDRLEKLGKGQVPKLEFYTVAIKLLNNLAEHNRELDTVSNFGFWNGKEIVYLAQSTHNAYMQFKEGGKVPAYCSALGKAILSTLSEEELAVYIENTEFVKFTEHTTTSAKKLREDIEYAKQHHFATMTDELCLGLKGMAVPVKLENSDVRYALSITQTLYGSMEPMIEIFTPLLKDTAEELKQFLELGIYKPPLL